MRRPREAGTANQRRRVVAALVCSLVPVLSRAAADPRGKGLELTSLHTGETLFVAANEDGLLGNDAAGKFQRLLRDHRSGDDHPIDALLFPRLLELATDLGVEARYQLISGYRSPVTNKALHEKSSGVAEKSLHMEGRALDVRLKGVDCLRLAELARSKQWGGVGYYRKSDFVHIDTGRVRTWDG